MQAAAHRLCTARSNQLVTCQLPAPQQISHVQATMTSLKGTAAEREEREWGEEQARLDSRRSAMRNSVRAD